MTKTQIRRELGRLIKSDKIKFKDPTDKEYILDMINQKDDLDDIFRQLDCCPVENECYSYIEDLQDEFSWL